MMKFITGGPGSGKTKTMIQNANDACETTKGQVLYIDSTDKHVHQLNRQIRFISAEEFDRFGPEFLAGFICGAASENYDIQTVFIDGMDKIVGASADQLIDFAEKMKPFSEKNHLQIYVAASTSEEDAQKLNAYSAR